MVCAVFVLLRARKATWLVDGLFLVGYMFGGGAPSVGVTMERLIEVEAK